MNGKASKNNFLIIENPLISTCDLIAKVSSLNHFQFKHIKFNIVILDRMPFRSKSTILSRYICKEKAKSK